MRTLTQKVDLEPREVAGGGGQNRVPLGKECFKNNTLKQKVPFGVQKRVPLGKKCVKNMYP